MLLNSVCGARIRISVSPSLKVPLMNLICMTQQTQIGILYTIMLSDPGSVLLVDMLGFVLDSSTKKLYSKYFLISAFCKSLRGLSIGYIRKIV